MTYIHTIIKYAICTDICNQPMNKAY